MKASYGFPSLCLLLLIFTGFTAKAQLQTGFSANTVRGCSPLIVQFSDESMGSPTQWKWDLGNGTISYLQNPSASYFNSGTYTIKLIISNGIQTDSIVKTGYINVSTKPRVDFGSLATSGCFPLPVQFDDNSTAGTGTITSWQWDFGDGFSSSEQHPLHTYTTSGNFNVTLRVFNSEGCLETVSKTQYIQINSGVKASFTNSVPNVCSPPVLINFQNLSTGTGDLTYEWQFGDGNSSTAMNPVHSYNATGSYTVQLVVTNSTGCKDTILNPGAVTVGIVSPGFSLVENACAGNALQYTNTSIPAPASTFWSFGDGTTSTQKNPLKGYSLPGTYEVKMIANFGSCSDSIVKKIEVLSKPTAGFFANDSTNCQAPFNVVFTNTSTNADNYQWLFGDNTTSDQSAPLHTYTQQGNYTVELIATGSNGCKDTLKKNNYIRVIPPLVSINNLADSGCAPFTKSFSATISSVDPVTGYSWDFGDGSTSNITNPTHVYSTPGTYTVKLVTTTAAGCTDTTVVLNAIFVNTKPIANFIASPRDACAKMQVNFTDVSVGNPVKWRWEFGDGSFSTAKNPSHVFNDTGYFDIQLIIWNGGCVDTVVYEEYIHIKPPIARFTIQSNCNKPFERIFTDQSIGADEWLWDFGDGTTSNLQNPTHDYPATGDYNVKLIIRNNLSGCDYSVTKPLQVVNVQPSFQSPNTTICRGGSVNFITNLSSTAVKSYNWNFGDGSIVDSLTNTASHIYKVAGTYSVTLITSDVLGCKDSFTQAMYVTVNGPTAKFAPSVPGSCQNNTVLFNDQSTSDGIHSIQSWSWNYADGVSETLTTAPFQHTYSTAGNYKVSLLVTDSEGCTDSTKLTTGFIVSKPMAKFSSPDTASCPGKPVQFTNQSTGPGLRYAWEFGDGLTGTNQLPTHSYNADGMYPVKLVVTDQFGCMDSISKPGFINVSTSIGNFIMSDSFSTCPPLIVQFTNRSVNAASQLWDFGDGSTAVIANPSHFYSYPGNYVITLTVKGNGGCTQVLKKNILINGPTGTFNYNPLSGCNPVTVNFSAATRDRTSFTWDFNNGVTSVTTDSILSFTYTNQGSYVPKMILVDPNGCQVPVTGKDTILVSGVIAGFNFKDQIVCDGGNVSFIDSSLSNDLITQYQWFFGDGTSSIGNNPEHLYTNTGLYLPKLVVSTKSGCVDSALAAKPLKIVASPKAGFTKTSDGCTPLVVNFKGMITSPDTSAVTWTWDLGNGNSSMLKDPPAQAYLTSGTYNIRLTVTNSSGCADTVLQQVAAYILPAVNAGTDTVICQNIGVRLQATGAASYQWNAAKGLSCLDCATPMALPDSVTRYVVRGVAGNGCSASDTIVVRVKYPFKIITSKADTLCKGQNTKLFATGADKYVWSPSTGLNNTGTDQPTAQPDSSLTYTVIGKDVYGCFADTGYIPVKVYPVPTVNAGMDQTINVGQTIDLVPVLSPDVTTVTWSPTGAIFRNNYPAITVRPNYNTEYTVEVKNRGGCMTRDRVNVLVVCNGTNVFIPNTFSPNGDGANDVFYPRGTGLFKIKTLKIFNRWGQLVFERTSFNANDLSAGWDGTYKGVKLPSDVFVYMIDIICDNNSVLPFKGNIALVL